MYEEVPSMTLRLKSNQLNQYLTENLKNCFQPNFFKICFSKFGSKSLNGNIGILHRQTLHIRFDYLRSINIDFEHISNIPFFQRKLKNQCSSELDFQIDLKLPESSF